MRAYELMVIISGDLDENTAHGWVRTISQSVTAAGGTIHGDPDWWGRRRLAYPINKKEDGFYAVFNVIAEGGALDDVERTFRISDDIVRHKLLRLPDHEAARRGMTSAA
jgi:small subunit ribosomal protein S6